MIPYRICYLKNNIYMYVPAIMGIELSVVPDEHKSKVYKIKKKLFLNQVLNKIAFLKSYTCVPIFIH